MGKSLSSTRTKLIKAVVLSQTDLISELLSGGEDVNKFDSDGRTPLIYACINVCNQSVNLLLKWGADVNASDYIGYTALHFAAQNRSRDIAEKLLNHGAYIESEDLNGNTPLSNAVFYARDDGGVIELLLENGGDPDHCNKYGVSPRSLAQTIANYDLTQYFD